MVMYAGLNVTAFFIAVFVSLVVVPLVGGWYTSPQRRRLLARRPIEQRATTAIAALKEGEPAKIRGVVAAREPLLASAIGGQACVGYRARIEEPHDTWAAEILSREAWSSFIVKDETGTVVVEGRLEILIDASDGAQALPPRAFELLKQDDVRMNDLWGARQFAFRETLLKVGDRVCVVGRPSRGGDPAAPWVMRGIWYEPIVVADDYESLRALPAGAPSALPLQLEAPVARGPSRREIDRQATTTIATLREGGDEPAKIQGVVAAREPLLTSPVSGRACIGYRIIIEGLGPGSPPVVRREAWPSFLVTDDTGTAAAEGPFSILLDPDDGGWTALPPQVYALLEEAGVPAADMFARDEGFRFKETLLEPGDRVSVVGRPSLEIDQAGRGSFRAPPRLFVLRGSEQEPVAVTEDAEPIG
jgi:hypothetical protein